ncbi:13327_t:CDS:10 [Funneliformis geosporum]|uniref:Pheromone-processing carboxypeptidase KEX1 n=1 Tax=Funneliformis geosporum TaxID=1117311 RepID=A0A9W4SXG0_9GLOM|nr:16860_t:CDS:10 [Funneliformis geosporum]CAI2185363.1 13327_t:CDS:10 [Funneliformis geosporum]
MKFKLKALALTIGLATIAFTNVSEAATAADYYVRSLPGLPDHVNLKSHAGHITIDELEESNIFFWLMHNRHIANKPKLIIWLNGGPGCMDGVFLETGPFRVNEDQTLKPLNGAWNEFANVLYVDQPVGTGFSFTNHGSYVKNMTQVPQQFLSFLDRFFEVFPEYSQDDMYLAGESFAGTFIPYIANGILKRNNERKTPDYQKYNLRGIAIGNGWIDPNSQNLAESQLKVCNDALKGSSNIKSDVCEEILAIILQNSRKRVGKVETCINQYDIRDHSDSYPSCGLKWPYELATVYKYLRRPDVVKSLHATKRKDLWVECSSTVGMGFDGDKSPPSITVYQDIICNYMGTEALIGNLEWNGYKGFQNNTKLLWYVNDTLAGNIVTERNLTYVKVFNASHMVPYDVPLVTMDMMYRFMGLDHHIEKFPSRIESEELNNDKQHDSDSGNEQEIWNRYYDAGTTTLIIVIIGVIGLAVFIFRGKIMKKFRHTKVDTEVEQFIDSDGDGDSDTEDNHKSDDNKRTNKIYKDEEQLNY